LAERERRYADAVALVRQGDRMKIIDPEYARLRPRILFRSAEELLASGKRGAAAALLDQIASRPEGEDAATWLPALRWAHAPPDAHLLVVGTAPIVLGLIPLAWKATARGLAIGGSSLPRALLLRAEILLHIKAEPKRTLLAIEGARALAQRAHDTELVAHAAELAHQMRFYRMRDDKLSQHAI